MNSRKLFLALLSSSTLLLTNCGGPNFTAAPDSTITISPQITSLNVNGTQTFTATVTGTSAKYVTWGLDDSGLGIVGAFSQSGTGTAIGATVTYNAPATPPIYAATPWSSQGTIGISANVPSGTGFVEASVAFPIIGPTSVGMQPATTSVQLGKSVSLFPYCVGWANNGINWLVNGVANGNAATGTMTVSPLQYVSYTAPAAMPTSGDTVTVTAVCQADSTKTASTTVTLTQ